MGARLARRDAGKCFWLNLLSAVLRIRKRGMRRGRRMTRIVDNLHHDEKWMAIGVLPVAASMLWLRWHGTWRGRH